MHVIRVQGTRENEVEIMFDEERAKTFPNLVKDIYLKIQESQRTPSKINKKKVMSWHITDRLL